jgi:hypothetical protein
MAQDSVTIAVAAVNTAYSGTLTPRYQFVSVLNETGGEIFVRTDGSAATVDGDFCTLVANGERALLANMAPLWNQSQTVVRNGSVNQWAQSKNGGVANPGTSVSVISPTGVTLQTTPPAVVTVQGAG